MNRGKSNKFMAKISSKLLESLYLLEVLTDLLEHSGKECTIISVIEKNIRSAFQSIENSRNILK